MAAFWRGEVDSANRVHVKEATEFVNGSIFIAATEVKAKITVRKRILPCPNAAFSIDWSRYQPLLRPRSARKVREMPRARWSCNVDDSYWLVLRAATTLVEKFSRGW